MQLNEVFNILEKNLSTLNGELEFSSVNRDDNSISFEGDKGAYRLTYDGEAKVFAFDCAYEKGEDGYAYSTVSKSLFDLEAYTERDAKSLANETADELSKLFKSNKKVDLEKVKMPKAVSRTKAKNGIISYDTDSLANRFGVLFPDMKNLIKQNIADYGEFLPETFFQEYGTARVLDVIANGSKEEQKKLFKMLNEVYEDGTNEVQDIIGVTILGEMKNDPKLMAVADEYMIEYMAGPVHEINKLTRKNSSLTKKLKNPPPYKPKKAKKPLMSELQQQNR
ncbi:MAG: hypothetical protein J5964_06775 [Eubacterium sp.]|nr:hypothetical protein [Eubacterium sp.]